MKALCVENDSAAKKDKSFIVGETEVTSSWAGSSNDADDIQYEQLFSSALAYIVLKNLIPFYETSSIIQVALQVSLFITKQFGSRRRM